MDNPPPKSWSIHTRPEITAKYEILERVGSGAYSDVYRARRLWDGAAVALKEVHDYQSAFREIEALQALAGHPNVVEMSEYFWRHDEDAVLVLEFLPTDLASVIAAAKSSGAAIPSGELKTWMLQILSGLDSCHRSSIVHRDIKPGNLLIAADGTLKLADFGQARKLMDPGFSGEDGEDGGPAAPPEREPEGGGGMSKAEEYLRVLDEVKARDSGEGPDFHGGDGSGLATCTASEADPDDDPLKDYGGGCDQGRCLTSCVGTRWFRAPELLFGSTDYGLEVDLWSLGCVFAELMRLEPLFPGTADVDQLSRIINVLGNLTEDVWPGCVGLPDYRIISFGRVDSPVGLEACLPGRSAEEVSLVKRLVRYDPASRATAAELMGDGYFGEEPLPVPLSELRVPLTRIGGQDGDSPGGWRDYDDIGSDSEFFDEFGSAAVTATKTGFSIRFS